MNRQTRRGAILVFAVTAVAVVATAASVGAGINRTGVSAAESQYEKKVTICHRTGSKKNPFRTIRVSRNAVPAHLRHGDALGACGPNAVFTMCHQANNGKQKTVKVKGTRKAAKALKKGDKLGKCKAKPAKPEKEKQKGKDKGKDKDKGKKKGPGKKK
jgi:hypothetical protein